MGMYCLTSIHQESETDQVAARAWTSTTASPRSAPTPDQLANESLGEGKLQVRATMLNCVLTPSANPTKSSDAR